MTNKTAPTGQDVSTFIAGIEDKRQRDDSQAIIKMMAEISGEPPVMWGTSIAGFGTLHYEYASGREGDWMKIGFSPRKGKISIYLTNDIEAFMPLLDKLGKYKLGKGCLYIAKLSDIDLAVLAKLIRQSYKAGGLQRAKSEEEIA